MSSLSSPCPHPFSRSLAPLSLAALMLAAPSLRASAQDSSPVQECGPARVEMFPVADANNEQNPVEAQPANAGQFDPPKSPRPPVPPELNPVPADQKSPTSASFTTLDANRLDIDPDSISIGEDGKFHFTSNTLKSPADWQLSDLNQLSLRGNPAPDIKQNTKVELVNKDFILGNLVEIGPDAITIATASEKPIQIKRSMISKLEFFDSQNTLYSGPFSLENWIFKSNSKALSGVVSPEGDLVLGSRTPFSAMRDMGEKTAWHLRTKLVWKNNLALNLSLFSDKTKDGESQNSYIFLMRGSYALLRKQWNTPNGARGQNMIGSHQIGDLQDSRNLGDCILDIYADPKTGTFSFFINGIQQASWKDTALAANSNFGSYLVFSNPDDGMESRTLIKDLKVKKWSGNLPANASEAMASVSSPGQTQSDSDKIQLVNGDEVNGKITKIEGDVMFCKTPQYEIRIPLNRATQLKFPTGSEQPRRMKGDAVIYLNTASRITLQISKWQDGKVYGRSEAYGDVVIPQSAISRVEFNIYNPKLKILRGSN